MITPTEVRRFWVDEDLSTYDRDVLEFNHRQLMRGLLDYCDTVEKQHSDDLGRLRGLIDSGTHAMQILRLAERSGRKTVRVSDTIAEATRRIDASRCQVPNCNFIGKHAHDSSSVIKQ